MNEEIKIYVACLAAYNSGILHGEWIDANQSAEEITEAVQAMLKKSPEASAEEWAIHDYQGFGPIKLSESESFETVSALAKAIEEHGEIFAHFYANQEGSYPAGDIDSAVSDFKEKGHGGWDSLADYVADFWEQSGEIKESSGWHPYQYIDWDRMAHDLEISGDVFTIELNGKVHVFNNY